MQKVDVNLMGTDGGTLTILEGKALEQKPPQKIEISGDIKTVSSYLKIRKTDKGGSGLQVIDPSKAVITVDKAAMTLELELDPENFYGAVITGNLELSDELKKWNINPKSGTLKQKDIIQLVRHSRLDFDTNDGYDAVLVAFQKFSFKAFIDSQNEAPDRLGNKRTSIEKKVETGLPETFILNIPIFKGQPSKAFRVEIMMDSTETTASFWLESVELTELIKTDRDVIFNEQLLACEGFVIINK